MLERWGDADFTILDRFLVDEGIELDVYAPRDEASFIKLCSRGGSSLTCIFAFPASAELDRIKAFVQELQAGYRYSDLCHLQAFLEAADWVYALDRCHMDVAYSVFTSHQSNLVAGVGSLAAANLLAVF